MFLHAFQSHVKQHFPFLTENTRLLATVSGGIDSIVLVHLCVATGLDIGIGHCNFKLRGEESDADALFVKELASKFEIPFHETSFDTYAYAKKHTLSTQMAARDLRYAWFKEVVASEAYDYILTAHHRNDSVETFLINATRGTGIEGLTGIPAVSGQVLRLLLPFSRKQIHQYATENTITWREDSSNASDAYVRNAMRHHVLPALEIIRPDATDRIEDTMTHLQQSVALLETYTKELKERYFYPLNSLTGPSAICLDISKLKQHPNPKEVLYVLYKDYGFTSWIDIYQLVEAQSGKQLFSGTHRLLKDRTSLQLYEHRKEERNKTTSFEILNSEGIFQGEYGKIEIKIQEEAIPTTPNQISVDREALHFPLIIRHWEAGDYFYPTGMEGKKKVNKYFKDEKLSLVAKENTWLLCDQKGIIWILGHRADRRYSAHEHTKKRLKITYSI
ncbi:tRNA lysidine(34) synthetase TilS [Dokdonia ponticola]|uniref:tRNA(Ile)-lysidine synthase n=1 Tax=Dokdonia ponticola TaxID=2041041 RepID=A0ABV9I0M5_9FLAO